MEEEALSSGGAIRRCCGTLTSITALDLTDSLKNGLTFDRLQFNFRERSLSGHFP